MTIKELFSAGPLKVDWSRVKLESPELYKLAESIRQDGLLSPILIKDGKVKDGIHRMLVLWLMGYKGDVPTQEL